MDTENSATPAEREFFLFELDGELYAVSVEDVDQVMKIPPVTSVPNAPDSIIGIFHLRGRVIVVLDLLKRLRLSRRNSFVPNYLFVTHHAKNSIALLVDRPRIVVHVPLSAIAMPDPALLARLPVHYISGTFVHREEKPLQRKSDVHNIMIEPESHEVSAPAAAPEFIEKPVLILALGEILNQEDILGVASAV